MRTVCSKDSQFQVRSIERNVLEYLLKNPEARDTLEGIIEWWILEREIRLRTEQIKEAIQILVEKGFVLQHETADTRIHYTINTNRYQEVEDFIKNFSCGCE